MKKITKIRIRNGIFLGILVALVGLGLYTGLNSDGKNRFWEGKALGGSIAVMGLSLYLIGTAALEAYKKHKTTGGIGSTFKKGFMEVISTDWHKVKRKRK